MRGDIVFQGNYVVLHASNGRYYYYNRQARPLGEGAIGKVFLGYSKPTHSGEESYPVAIKQVKEKYANIPSVRFRAKQESLLTFRHPNMIEILGYCEENPNTGLFFMISKYVKGDNIDVFIKRNFSSFQGLSRVKHICTMFYPVMESLSFLHRHGIVHMDIKPSNIMVENGRNVRLMDLGIAHTEHIYSANSSSSSTLMGTPQYAAPEQFESLKQNQTISPQTDVFALGITIYELLTNTNPLKCATLNESIQRHQNLELPYSSEVPKELVDVLRKATSRAKSIRFANMADFKNAIQMSLVEKPQPWWKRYFC